MSVNTETSSENIQNLNGNSLRKRKNFFDCGISQKIRNKNLILMQTEALSNFCNSIGLKIDEIILSPKIDQLNVNDIKINILPYKMSKDLKIFKCLMAKDLTNLSIKKYSIMKQTLKEINGNSIPNINKILNLQYKLNDLYELQSNEKGFFIDPIKKIKFVCEKFLLKNPDFSEKKFKIKLSADGTNISKKFVKLLNFTFNLLDENETAMNVIGCYSLGIHFYVLNNNVILIIINNNI